MAAVRTRAVAGTACRVLLVATISLPTALADDARARVNYMLHCQGCHLPEAVGVPGTVPRMSGFLGYFLHSNEGREYVVRVPGVATSPVPDDQLAELMNWILVTYSADQLPSEYRIYTEAEIARLRQNPDRDPEKTRHEVLVQIAADIPTLAKDLQHSSNYQKLEK